MDLAKTSCHAKVSDTESRLAAEATTSQRAQAEAATLKDALATLKSDLSSTSDQLTAERAAGA